MVNGERRGVYLDFADAIKRDGLKTIEEKYGIKIPDEELSNMKKVSDITAAIEKYQA